MNFTEALDHVLKHEGGFVDHPKDPGGMTNLGVTRAVFEEWVGRESSEKEIRALTPADVSTLYKRKYWDRVKLMTCHQALTTAFLMLVLTQVLDAPQNGFRRLWGLFLTVLLARIH
jgi:lysozyme family protein